MSHQHHEAIVEILSSIDKGHRQQVVQAIDKILCMLEESKLVYRLTLAAELVGCHMANRNGYGLSAIEVHSVGADIVRLGWSWEACDHAVCMEVTVGVPSDTSQRSSVP